MGLDEWATAYYSICTNGNNRGTSLDTNKLPTELWMREMKVVLNIDDIRTILADHVEEHHNDTSRSVNEEGITFLNGEGIPVQIHNIEIPLSDEK